MLYYAQCERKITHEESTLTQFAYQRQVSCFMAVVIYDGREACNERL
jgi:hypothetical protein